MRRHASALFSIVHNFAGGSDGVNPQAGLTKLKGVLYGTTGGGGASSRGTVFAIPAFRPEATLYSFVGYPSDGSDPAARLVNVNGTLYGTTDIGGTNALGTIFSITPSGAETVLHSFAGYPSDGSRPSGLIKVKGTLYGTTAEGGANNDGTVFSFTPSPSGAVTTLYSFAGGSDGATPKAGLVNLKGTFYGTTFSGGTNCGSSGGCGTVFAITPAGAESVLHSFGAAGDGSRPVASLIAVNGAVFGTTYLGGENCGTRGGCGIVFSVTPAGAETVIHSFSGEDGANPSAALISVKGTLYGTTASGGGNADGTVFAIPPFRSETVLHAFSGSDGSDPQAALLNVNGTLYGTTQNGGAHGDGTVFSLTP